MKNTILLLIGLGLLAGMAEAGEIGEVDIHGFLSQGYLKTDHNNYMAETEDGSFQFNELGLNFGTRLSGKLWLGMQFFARDLGTDGNDELVLDWAVADYRWQDFLGVRVGKIKNNYGYYAAIRDVDLLRTSVFVPRSIYSEMFRDATSSFKGVSFYGEIELGGFGSMAYDFVNGLPNMGPDTGLASGWENYWAFLELDVTNLKSGMSFTYDLKWETPLNGLMLGFTRMWFNDIEVDGTLSGNLAEKVYHITGFHEKSDLAYIFLTIRYAWQGFVLMGEFAQNDMDRRIDMDGFEGGYLDADSITTQGWYAGMAYRFNRYFEAEYKYSEYYGNRYNKDGKDVYDNKLLNQLLNINGTLKSRNDDFLAWTKTSTFSFRFDISEYWLFKFEIAYNDGFGELTSAQTDDLKRYWWLYAAKVTYNF